MWWAPRVGRRDHRRLWRAAARLAPGGAVTAAVAVGACNVEAADALSGIRPWDDTLAAWPPAGRGEIGERHGAQLAV